MAVSRYRGIAYVASGDLTLNVARGPQYGRWRPDPLFLERGGPVQHDVDRRCRGLGEQLADEESLAVRGRAIIAPVRRNDGGKIRREEGGRNRGLERFAGSNGDAHQVLFRAEVEELFSIASPPRLAPAVRRDLPASPLLRELRDVDLEAARLVRRIGDPVAVRRDLALRLGESR